MVQALRGLRGRIEEMERQKQAAVAQEDYRMAGSLKQSIAELVKQKEEMERQTQAQDRKPSVEEVDSKPSAEEEAVECVVCLDARRTNILMPCRHVCVCEACAATLRLCPICRGEVRDQFVVFFA